jgi:Fe-coproporphyrin III synthase
MRYARLKKEWLLRGWTDEPRALVNWTNGDCRKLSEELFLTAKACDGHTDFDNIAGILLENIRLDVLIKAGMAEECGAGEGMQPYQRLCKADNPYIHSVHWSVTGQCNLKCRHCYMESPDGRYGELPLQDMLHIIDQLAAANVHQVQLTGGEPFLRSDLPDILAALADNRIGVSRIYSNGTLIRGEVLRNIKKLGLSPSVQISFDGCGTHDAMRGIVGTEPAAVEAIRLLREHDFPVVVATSIDRANIGSLAATYALMKELDIQLWRVAPPQETGNWPQSATGLTLEEILPACASVAATWSEDGRPFALQIRGYSSGDEDQAPVIYCPGSYDCMSCRITCSLLPDGTVLPCPAYTDTAVYEKMPNLLLEPFAKVWSASALRTIVDIRKSEVLANNSECAACAEFERCGGGCRAAAMSATGDLLSVDPKICEMFKSNFQRRFSELAGLGPKTG